MMHWSLIFTLYMTLLHLLYYIICFTKIHILEDLTLIHELQRGGSLGFSSGGTPILLSGPQARVTVNMQQSQWCEFWLARENEQFVLQQSNLWQPKCLSMMPASKSRPHWHDWHEQNVLLLWACAAQFHSWNWASINSTDIIKKFCSMKFKHWGISGPALRT